jgi:hypothetical protein
MTTESEAPDITDAQEVLTPLPDLDLSPESEGSSSADQSAEDQTQAHGYQSGDELEIDPARCRDIMTVSRTKLVINISQVVAKALGQMSGEMTELSTKKVDPQEQQILVDAAALVDLHMQLVESRFLDEFNRVFDRQIGVVSEEASLNVDQELALVEDSIMSNKLKIERLVKRTRDKLDSEEVLGIRARFGALLGQDWFDEDSQPAAPGFIYEALQCSIEDLGETTEIRSALLEAFEPYLTANLNSVYANVNKELAQQNVLPLIKPRVQVNPDNGRGRGSADADQPEEGLDSLKRATGAVDEDTFILPPAGPARDAIVQALANQVADGGALARSSAVKMLAEPKNFATDDGDITEPDSDLIDRLDSLQAKPDAQNRETIQNLTDQARSDGSPLDQLTVEIVSLIFDYLYDDPRIPVSVKTQLLRLQVVAVKAALLDRSFFASRQHPMRRLIDRASELSCDPDTNSEEGSEFVNGLSEIVDNVLETFDRDLGVFVEAVNRLAELESNEETRRSEALSELTAEAEETEALTLAQERANIDIEQRVDEETPAFVAEFLQNAWAHVLVDISVNEGESYQEIWDEHLVVAEQLIWSVVASTSSELNRMALVLPKMIGGLNKGIERLPEEERGQFEPFFSELMKWHTNTIVSAKKRKGKVTTASASANVELQEDGTVKIRKLEQAKQQEAENPATIATDGSIVDELVKGQKLELRESEAEPLIVKLSWVSPARKLFALSKYPDFARSVARAEMISMLECGRLVRVVDEDAPVGRAISAVSAGEEVPERDTASN